MSGAKLPQSILAAIRKPKATIKSLLAPTKARAKFPKIIKGVYKGSFYRIKLPERKPRFNVPVLGLTPPMPAPFKDPSTHQQTSDSDFFSKFKGWWKENWSVLVLNFGSLCTLTGFTRSDVLELRTFSAMGSFSFVLYNLSYSPRRWNSIAWSCLFAAVNTIKIGQILTERKARVVLTDQQEAIFVETFMPHGVTPKQFELIWHKAKIVTRNKGDVIVMAGKPMDQIYLVIQGITRAHILGRHLTAASSAPGSKHKEGGDSGAWIGEMAFLERVFEKEKVNQDMNNPRTRNALYTIVANEDCVLLEWTHGDMEELMGRSTDMRGAMTRAMTAAIVGKVINFTVSRTTAMPTWSAWLNEWKYAGAKVKVDGEEEVASGVDDFEKVIPSSRPDRIESMQPS